MPKQQSKYAQGVMSAIIVMLLSTIAVLVLYFSQGNRVLDVKQTDASVEKNDNFIAIPGFETLELDADAIEQSIRLPNPPQNTCYFRITLCLADGTVLWNSDYIKPGKTSSPIKLSEPLAAGTYSEAVLHYECFRMDKNRSPLNGAETELTLLVK